MTQVDELLHRLSEGVKGGDEVERRATEAARRALRAAVASEPRRGRRFARARGGRGLAVLGGTRGVPRVMRMLPGVLSVAAVLVVVAVIITVGAHKPSGQHAGAGTAPSDSSGASHHTNGSAGTRPASYFLDYLLPSSGADWAAGGRLNAFTLEVRIKAESQCLATEGLPGPPVAGPQTADGLPGSAFGNVDFPNMPVIRRTGNVGVTSGLGPTDPAKRMSAARRKAYQKKLSSCAASAQTTDLFYGSDQPSKLMTEWMNFVIPRVNSSPAVHAANRRAAACSHKTSFPASTTGGEIEAIEAKLTPLNIRGQDAQAKAVNASGVRVLVKCFGAVVSLRDRLLAAQRVKFFAAHAHPIGQITDQVNRVVAADEAKYGIKLSAMNPKSAPSGIGSQ